MYRPFQIGLAAMIALALLLGACGEDEEAGEHDSSSGDSDGAEESGTEYSKDEAYDETRGGARLRLTYDPAADAFVGTVENTTDQPLDEVRVEVHLSNGVELGPTTPGPLPPGQTADINLPANGETFDAWSGHPEVGRDEHGGEGEGGEEHSEGAHGSPGAR